MKTPLINVLFGIDRLVGVSYTVDTEMQSASIEVGVLVFSLNKEFAYHELKNKVRS